jgi:hypothetical protein
VVVARESATEELPHRGRYSWMGYVLAIELGQQLSENAK